MSARAQRLDAPVHLVRGADETLVNEAVVDLVSRLVGDGDRSLMVEELSAADTGREAGGDDDSGSAAASSSEADPALVAAVTAARTPAFLTPRRIVVLRRAGQFGKVAEVAPLIEYLASPEPGASLVVVWEAAKGRRLATVPRKLAAAIEEAGGEVVLADPGSGKGDRAAWWSEQLAAAPVELDARAAAAVRDQLGDDLGEWPELLQRLVGVHGEGASLGLDDVTPLLGRAGGVPPWDLTDAIDRGDTAGALDLLHRMLEGGGRHPLQVMATLQSHFLRMARLDGSGVRAEREAAALLGMKGSTYPAKKALTQSGKLGHAGVVRAVALLAEADVTLRGGGRSWPGDLVMEVLVARLTRLARR